jgi:hypothetical protein
MKILARAFAVSFLFSSIALLTPGCSSPTTPEEVHVDPTFTSIKTNVFAKNCTTSSCHGELGQRGGLLLEGGAVYDNLVGVMAENDTAHARGLVRVNPGKPDSSFLIIKLTGPAAGEGERMPYENAALNAQAIDAIRTWIANGAPRN